MHIPYLRSAIYSLLTTTTTGATILRDYHQTNKDALSTLPSLCPIKFPNRDIYAQDYVISAMATLLHTTIHIYTYNIDHNPVKISFSPYPKPHHLDLSLPTPTSHISILATNNHFQLLLPYKLDFPSITSNLTPLPKLPNITTTPEGIPTFIPAPSPLPHQPRCPYQPPPLPNSPPAFCPSTCHSHCPNQHSAFKSIPHQITPPLHDGSQLLSLIGIESDYPIFEIHSVIHPHPTPTTSTITPNHNSNALHTHPLIQLMYSSEEPNVTLTALLVPDPQPYLQLFVVTCRPSTPYTPLRLRPPPEPPPIPISTLTTMGQLVPTTRRSTITAHFPSLPR